MRRPSIVILAVVAIAFVALLVAGSFVPGANTIDDVAWRGDPVPPCFVDAAHCGGHVLGTDEVGRDLLARLLVGAQTTLGFTFLAALLTFAFASIFAMLTRFGGRAVRYVVARLSVGVSSLPAWTVLIALIAVGIAVRGKMGPGWTMLIIVSATLSWPKMADLLGSTRGPVPVLNRFLRDWASLVLLVSTIEFFGYGMTPPTPSWGNMLSSMEATLQTGWWVGFFPGLCIFVAVFGLRAVARYALSSTSGATDASGSPTSG
jgi:peptide/nickel transport system permease protein